MMEFLDIGPQLNGDRPGRYKLVGPSSVRDLVYDDLSKTE